MRGTRAGGRTGGRGGKGGEPFDGRHRYARGMGEVVAALVELVALGAKLLAAAFSLLLAGVGLAAELLSRLVSRGRR